MIRGNACISSNREAIAVPNAVKSMAMRNMNRIAPGSKAQCVMLKPMRSDMRMTTIP